MKTSEEILEQWVGDRIHFSGSSNLMGKEFWTRYELSLIAQRIRNDNPDWTLLDWTDIENAHAVMDSFSSRMLMSFDRERVGGPEITAPYLAQFDSFDELVQHFSGKGWQRKFWVLQ